MVGWGGVDRRRRGLVVTLSRNLYTIDVKWQLALTVAVWYGMVSHLPAFSRELSSDILRSTISNLFHTGDSY